MRSFLQQVLAFLRATGQYFRQNPPLYFLLFLNIMGLFLLAYGRAAFLAYLLLIAMTVAYFFVKGAVLQELELHVTDVEAHPGGVRQVTQEVAALSHAVAQLDQIAGEIGQIKQTLADFESYKKGLSAMRLDLANALAIEDEVAKLSEEIGKAKAAVDEVAKLKAALAQYDGLKQGLQEGVAGREALAKAINALRADLNDLRSQTERVDALSESVKKLEDSLASQGTAQVEEMKKALAGLQEETGGAVPSPQLKQKLGQIEALGHNVAALNERIKKLDGIEERLKQAAPAGEGASDEKLKKLAAESAELEGKLARMGEEMEKANERLRKLDGIAKAAGGGSAAPEVQAEVEALRGEMAEIAKAANGDIKDLSDELRRDIAAIRSQMEGIAGVEGIDEAIANLREEVAGLRGRKRGEAGAADEGLRKEVEELKKTVADMLASQPRLEIEVDKARLVTQQDRTLIHCSVRLKNPSNKPNEIVAVRADLDAGKDRMTPTSVRNWMPEGEPANGERKVFLPMTILENSTTGKIALTVAGWPLERTQDSYAFRVTVRDKNGNEFVKSLSLKPEKQA